MNEPSGTDPPGNRPPDDRSSLATAMEWSSTVITISIEMVVPGLLGYWVDKRLGTGVLLLVVGMVLGVTLGIWQLIRITKIDQARNSSRTRKHSSRLKQSNEPRDT